MKKFWEKYKWIPATIIGSAIFAFGFAVFLQPHDMNAGGISGLAQIIVELSGFGSVGVLSILINLPLFVLGGLKIGKRFFLGAHHFSGDAADGVLRCSVQQLQQIFCRERLQFKDRGPRQQCTVDLEERILRCRSDQGQDIFLHEREKIILLGFIEAMDLIDEQDGFPAVRLALVLRIADNLFHLFLA